MTRLIDADALRERLQDLADDDWNQGILKSFADACNEIIEIVEEQPTVKVVSSQLTNEEIETIRIHINAFKEKLCNQLRYKEAEDYQQIVDKLDTMMGAEREEE